MRDCGSGILSRAALAGALVLPVAACVRPDPAADMSAGQSMLDLSDAVNGLRSDNALLQAQIDSLRGEVARQDTVIRRLAGAAGMPMP